MIIEALDQTNITRTAEREHARSVLTNNYQQRMDEWQIEKQQRIKSLLWWREVATAQAAQPANTTTDAPALTNLSQDAKAWHLHPVGVMGLSAPSGVTVAMLKQIFTAVPASRQALLQFMADEINAHMTEYKLDTPLRLSHFFSQIRQEVGASLQIVENFTYSVSGLKTTYDYFGKNPKQAERYGYPDKGRKYVSPDNQRIIANLAMGGGGLLSWCMGKIISSRCGGLNLD